MLGSHIPECIYPFSWDHSSSASAEPLSPESAPLACYSVPGRKTSLTPEWSHPRGLHVTSAHQEPPVVDLVCYGIAWWQQGPANTLQTPGSGNREHSPCGPPVPRVSAVQVLHPGMWSGAALTMLISSPPSLLLRSPCWGKHGR